MHATAYSPAPTRLSELELFDHVPIATCAVGEDRCIVYANAAFIRALGRMAQDVTGRAIANVGLHGVGDVLRSLVDRCFAEQRVIEQAGPRAEGIKVFPWTREEGGGERLVIVSVEAPREAERSASELQRQNIQLQRYAKGLELLVEERTNKLRDSIDQTLALLMNVLPKPVAQRLLAGEAPPAERFEAVTVMFVDVVGFTRHAAHRDPAELVAFLSALFDAFDALVEKSETEKIKTMGDCYLAVSGAPRVNARHAFDVCDLALTMARELARVRAQLGLSVEARFGINSGPVVAGVIGQRRFAYDVWGDTVNVASRMQTHGEPGMIQISEATFALVKDEFACEERGAVDLKGRGQVKTYWLLGRR